MKFFTVLLLLCAMAGCSIAVSTISTTTGTGTPSGTYTTTYRWTDDATTLAPAASPPSNPCGGFGGPCGKIPRDGKKLYFFY
ncbi:GL27270 [Drosophila persimilis]|uniref:GL27270 n=1 Tax=Drosophila persimilis TaxID=7234 RepID=B4GYY0_DROPE|nr:GL27270 [Drosophila persimilis]